MSSWGFRGRGKTFAQASDHKFTISPSRRPNSFGAINFPATKSFLSKRWQVNWIRSPSFRSRFILTSNFAGFILKISGGVGGSACGDFNRSIFNRCFLAAAFLLHAAFAKALALNRFVICFRGFAAEGSVRRQAVALGVSGFLLFRHSVCLSQFRGSGVRFVLLPRRLTRCHKTGLARFR